MLVIIEDFKTLLIVNEESLSFIMSSYNSINTTTPTRALAKSFSWDRSWDTWEEFMFLKLSRASRSPMVKQANFWLKSFVPLALRPWPTMYMPPSFSPDGDGPRPIKFSMDSAKIVPTNQSFIHIILSSVEILWFIIQSLVKHVHAFKGLYAYL